MSWRDATVYVEAHDLARWVLERTNSWPPTSDRHLGGPVAGAACDLLEEVSLALTFPRSRSLHLEAADEAIVRLRVLLRLAQSLALVSGGGLRFAAARLRKIGRMVGGWRKRIEENPRRCEIAAVRIEGTGRKRRGSGDSWRQLQERRTEGALRVPEQEPSGDRDQEPGLSRASTRRPEPAAEQGENRPRAGPLPAGEIAPPADASRTGRSVDRTSGCAQ